MEFVKKEECVKYVKPSCVAYEYPMKNEELNIGVVEITNRYPDQGYAINHECTEIGYVLKGSGKLVTEHEEVSLSVGDAALVPCGEKYYWEGTMTLLLPATPAWHPGQHESNID